MSSLALAGALSDTNLLVSTLGRVRRPEGPAAPAVMGTWPTVAAPFPVQDNWLLAALAPTLQAPRGRDL